MLADAKVQYASMQNQALWQVRQTNRIRTEVPGQLFIYNGTPNLENQVDMNVLATTVAVIELIGVASTQLVERSMKDKIYL